MPATTTNTDKVARNVLARTRFTTDTTNFPSLEKINPVKRSPHRVRNEVHVHARALRRGNGKDNKIDNSRTMGRKYPKQGFRDAIHVHGMCTDSAGPKRTVRDSQDSDTDCA